MTPCMHVCVYGVMDVCPPKLTVADLPEPLDL